LTLSRPRALIRSGPDSESIQIMASDNKDSTPIPVGGIAVLLVLAAGIFVKHQLPFESLRPTESDIKAKPTRDLQDVDARLWEDPFAALARYDQGEGGKQKSAAPEAPGADHDVQRVAQEMGKVGGALVLGVMVYAGPYGEDVELRRRTRYAVLAGLDASGYVPENNDKIGFFRLGQDRVPFEFFAKDGGGKILLLWLAEERLWTGGTASLAKVAGALQVPRKGDQRSADFTIIGPATSTGLKSLILEMDLHCDRGKLSQKPLDIRGLHVAFYSPASTAIPRDLLPSLPCLKEPPDARRPSEALLQQLFPADVSMVRTINNDGEVAAALVDELRLRGVADKPMAGDARSQVVLISEWDTDYGRKLPERFISAVCAPAADPDCTGSEDKDPSWVTRVSYMRGLDGAVPSTPAKQEGKESAADKNKESAKSAEPTERADGSSQYDYLRRLARTLEERTAGKLVTAVGVLGSDLYDKLLVLQALRPEFPDAVFFTTDLDARLVQPGQYRWTRNLLVGSGHGLELNPGLQGRTPPFRDGYQTAAFLATRLALDSSTFAQKADRLETWLLHQPRVYEIGRTQAFALAPSEKPETVSCPNLATCTDIRPPLPFFQAGPGAWKAVLLAVLPWALGLGATFFLLHIYVWPVRRSVAPACELLKEHWWARVVAVVALVGLGLLLHSSVPKIFFDPQGEPFAWAEGISVWPTELIRLAAIVLALCFIVRALRPVELEAESAGGSIFPRDTEPGGSLRKLDSVKIYRWYRRYHDERRQVDAAKLWGEFRYLEGRLARWKRLWLPYLLYLVLASCLFFALGGAAVPYRGPLSHLVDASLLTISVLIFFVLLFIVVDTIRLGSTMVRNLSTERSIYPLRALAAVRCEFGIDREDFVEPLCELLDIRLIGAYTEQLNRCIYFPFVVLTLLVVARSPIFDNWRTPPAAFLIFLFAFLATLACAVVLQRAAARAKTIAVERMTEYLAQARGESSLMKPHAAQLDMMLEEIGDARRGAFVPFLQQPVVRAFFVPAGSFGGIQLIEYALTGLSF
jgi:hypothetical protein